MKASDDKMRKTDCVSTEQLLRIIQSIPSKKAEPFKQWLALVGKERLDEIADPELAFERMIDTYRKKAIRKNGLSNDFMRLMFASYSQTNGNVLV